MERIALRDENQVIRSGILEELVAGLSLTRQGPAMRVMCISHNTAANIVMVQVGIENVNRTLGKLGLFATREQLQS